MLRQRVLGIALSAALIFGICTPSFADGDPNNAPATALDKALDDLEKKDAPVAVEKPAIVVKEAPVTEPAPVTAPPPVVVIEKKPTPAVPESRIVEVQPENKSFFGLSIGVFSPNESGLKAVSLNAEWQPGVKIVGILQPIFGAFVTSRGSYMGYGGIGMPFKLGKHIFIMPSFSAGGYGHGDGKDLGQGLAFRAGGEVAYQFDDMSRIGINAHIITNGKSSDKQDNTAMIGLVYTMPFDLFSGRPRPDTRAADKAVLEKPAKSVK